MTGITDEKSRRKTAVPPSIGRQTIKLAKPQNVEKKGCSKLMTITGEKRWKDVERGLSRGPNKCGEHNRRKAIRFKNENASKERSLHLRHEAKRPTEKSRKNAENSF